MGQFDGIQEREAGKNRMPLGMAILFLVLILCGLLYVYLFTPQTTGWTQAGQYQRHLESRKTAVITHEVKEAASGAAEGAKAVQGPAIYKSDCAMCHGDNLEGGIGPALTGPAFLYGGTLSDHMRVISDGTAKGMPGFGKQLGPEKVRAVAHYIIFKHTK